MGDPEREYASVSSEGIHLDESCNCSKTVQISFVPLVVEIFVECSVYAVHMLVVLSEILGWGRADCPSRVGAELHG